MGPRVTASQFLICSDDEQLAAGLTVFGERRKGLTRYQASNGSRSELDGADVLIWGTATSQDVERDRALAMSLAVDALRVRLFDMTISGMQLASPVDAVKAGWSYLALSEFAETLKCILTIPKPPAQEQELESTNGETGAGGSQPVDASNAIPAQERLGNVGRISAARPVSPSSNVGSADPSFLRVSNERSDDAGLPFPAPPEPAPLPPELPDWTREGPEGEDIAPSAPFHPGRAGRAYAEAETAPGGPEAWPDPVDLTKSLYHGLPMPITLVPAPLQPFVEDHRRRLGTPAGPVWFGIMGAISGLASDNIRLQPKQRDTDWTVHPVVWPLVIGGPSSGKSPAIEIGMRWVQKKDAEAVLENTRKLKEHEHLTNIYADECAVARKNKMPLPPFGHDEPTLREYWVSRGTTEGVTRLLLHSPKVVWYSQEFSSIVNGLDRYAPSGKGSGDREFAIQLYDGGPTKNTLAGKTVSIRNGSAVLAGGTTPSAMISCAGGKLQRDGLLARMLFCMVPDAMVAGEDTVPDADAAAVYNTVLDNLLGMTHAATIMLSPEAAAIYRDFCEALHLKIKSEDSEYLTGTLGKWPGAWGRLALIYWLTDCAAYGQIPVDGDRIPGPIAKQATDFLWWQLTHQRQFWYEIMADKSGRKFSQTIARYILANPELTTLNFRTHIARPHHEAIEKLKPWEIKDAINTLIAAAWISPQGLKINSHGVPASFDINPRLGHMFTEEREDELMRRAIRREALQAMRSAD